MRISALLIGTIAGGIAILSAACGGGSETGGTGSRITDPAAVPTSTPIQNPLTFRFKNEDIEIAGGGTTTAGTGTNQAQTHTVAAGETCAEIASRYGISVADLIRVNRTINADCTNLRQGENLRIPSAAPTAASGTPTPGGSASGRTHTVAAGDTCADIAASFGVSVEALITANGLDADCTNLQLGQVLKIP
ncbi:MAG: LysM domain-containing protein [Dehalococcoidia bacterium]